jgi:hypothetical protein
MMAFKSSPRADGIANGDPDGEISMNRTNQTKDISREYTSVATVIHVVLVLLANWPPEELD